MADQLDIRSYAKINWILDVLFKRADGFHELRTIYQTVSLHDRLRLILTSGSIEIECDNPAGPRDESNLIYKAADRLRSMAGVSVGVRILVEKRIPVGGGLGGGSSNAAATLIGLRRLLNLNITDYELYNLAAGLGSDVPFFLIGGTALGIGRGEEVYPIEEVICKGLLLANPGISVSTGVAYEALSRLTMEQAPLIMPFSLLAARGTCELPLLARNDLEKVVLANHPEIADLKNRMTALGARHALLSGSGATVFGVFDNHQPRINAQREFNETGVWNECVETISRRDYWETLFN